MSIAYNPRIVTDGVVLALDPANPKSHYRYENLMKDSEDPTEWTTPNMTSTGSTITLPYGGTIGIGTTVRTSTIVEYAGDSGFSSKLLRSYPEYQISAGDTLVYSVFLKKGIVDGVESVYLVLQNNTATEGFGQLFNFNQGNFPVSEELLIYQTISGNETNLRRGYEEYNDGWYRVWISCTFPSSASSTHTFVRLKNNGYQNETTSFSMWAPQLERGSAPSDYYKTVGTNIKIRNSFPTNGVDVPVINNLINDSNIIGINTFSPKYSVNYNGSLTFDGVREYLNDNSNTFPLANNLFADSNSSWTVSAWFNFPESPTQVRDDSVNSGNCSYSIVSRGGGIGPLCTFNLYVVGLSTENPYSLPNHHYHCAVNVRGVNTPISPEPVNNGTWNNAVIVWDGVSCNSYFNSVGITTVAVGTATVQTLQLRIGNASDELRDTGVQNFEGTISNVQIYNRALSASEVQQNFNALRRRFGI